jgi:hypothetical protein
MSQSTNFAGSASRLVRTSESFGAQLNTDQYLERPQTFTPQPSVPQWLQPPESMNYNYSAYLQNTASMMSTPVSGLGALDASTFVPDQSYSTVPTSPDQTRYQAFGVPLFNNAYSSSNSRTDSYLGSGPADSLSQYSRSPYLIQDVPSSSERSGSLPVDASSGEDLLAPSDLGYPTSGGSFSLNGHHGTEAQSSTNGTKLCDDANNTNIEWNTFVDFQDELED